MVFESVPRTGRKKRPETSFHISRNSTRRLTGLKDCWCNDCVRTGIYFFVSFGAELPGHSTQSLSSTHQILLSNRPPTGSVLTSTSCSLDDWNHIEFSFTCILAPSRISAANPFIKIRAIRNAADIPWCSRENRHVP
jgi:hypothetical protein